MMHPSKSSRAANLCSAQLLAGYKIPNRQPGQFRGRPVRVGNSTLAVAAAVSDLRSRPPIAPMADTIAAPTPGMPLSRREAPLFEA